MEKYSRIPVSKVRSFKDNKSYEDLSEEEVMQLKEFIRREANDHVIYEWIKAHGGKIDKGMFHEMVADHLYGKNDLWDSLDWDAERVLLEELFPEHEQII